MTDGTETITTLHFVLMALFAVLVVIAIIAGMRKKHARLKAQREVAAHAEEAGVEHEPVSEEASSSAEAPAPEPLAPPPPPSSVTPPAPAPMPSPVSDEPPAARPLADVPIAAATGIGGAPATIALDADVAEAGDSPADGPLTQIKGLGPKVATRLAELGIDRVGQLAALDEAEAAALDAQLGPFTGRMARDRWIEQAQLLTDGDRDGFERAFGRL